MGVGELTTTFPRLHSWLGTTEGTFSAASTCRLSAPLVLLPLHVHAVPAPTVISRRLWAFDASTD